MTTDHDRLIARMRQAVVDAEEDGCGAYIDPRDLSALLDARDHLARQEPTDAEQAARFAVESKHHTHVHECICGFKSARMRSHTEHIMGAYFEELTAAKEALS